MKIYVIKDEDADTGLWNRAFATYAEARRYRKQEIKTWLLGDAMELSHDEYLDAYRYHVNCLRIVAIDLEGVVLL